MVLMPHGYHGSVLPPVSLEKYTIVMWYGTLATIPAGWTLCDGIDHGSGVIGPDLRNYFVKGAPAGAAADNIGRGSDSHEHDISLRTATIPQGTGAVTAAPAHAHTTDLVNHEPPHKRIVFIMKT